MHLYLHVGLHKTGTTAIQKKLFYNRDYFRNRGLGYLSTEANNSMSIYSMFCNNPEVYHINVRKGINTIEAAKQHNDTLRRKIERDIQSSDTPIFVISGEDISHLTDDNIVCLEQFFRPLVDEITVVAYVRAPQDMVNSNCAQALKGGETFTSLERNLPKPLYKRRLEKFDNVFGAEAVKIRVYQSNTNIVHDFLRLVGFEALDEVNADVDRENVSISMAGAKFLNIINETFPLFTMNDGVRTLSREFDLVPTASAIEGDRFKVPVEWLNECLQVAKDEIEWLNQRIGDDISKYDISLSDDAFTPSLSFHEQKEMIRSIYEQWLSRT